MECFCKREPLLLHRDAMEVSDALFQINTYKDDGNDRWIVEFVRLQKDKTILKFHSYEFRDDAIKFHKYLRKHHFGWD